jgi:3-hydroxybutyryl-CoA dehydrogenase
MIRSICVCGAGTMGAGIAQAAAQHGFEVILYDLNTTVLETARLQMQRNLQSLVDKQKISESALESIFSNLQFVQTITSCKADIIIEAILEKAAPKIELFRQLFEINDDSTIFASNTSSLSITDIARAHPDPSRVAGMHFFNPPTVMKLVEVVKTDYTAESTVSRIVKLAADMGKTAVICKDSPGFIVNRVARPYYIEALRMAEQGVSIELIDALMESAGFKLGPFKLMDLIGNDVNYAVSCSVYEQLGSPARLQPSFLQQQKLNDGLLGRKSGAGFYTY